ncbi:MAG: hypothetical protein K2M94_04575 [Paramuribaculum sp.]|nr:hypothetical protein [Paramuribaculum sp.]
MNKLIILFISLLISGSAFAQSISNVEQQGNWYNIYNHQGKKVKTLSAATIGEVKGWCSEFLIAQDGSWFSLYNADGKKLKTFNTNTVGEVISVSANTFTTKMGNWIYTYDANGKKLNTRHQ